MSVSDLFVQHMIVRRVMRETFDEPAPTGNVATTRDTPEGTAARLREAVGTFLISVGERLRQRPALPPCPEPVQPNPCA